ncbi:MAG: ABC transporter ATP-binding protein [Planctomycetales bacterium]|nr:ABC transporter ATP-binding protein [Planctomycetales bacterium]
MNILEAIDVTKSYGEGEASVSALCGISIRIDVGEFVSIMGPSGSGKSSLLTILGGVETPTSGQVLIEGTSLSNLSDDERTKLRRRRLGFIFQAFNLLPNLSAEENIALPLELDGIRRAEAFGRAREALDMVELSHRATHLPSGLSGGEQQRVAIARALAIRPALLLADEPTGNLDTRQSGRILDLLRLLVSERGQTLVMVTHDPHLAALARRVILIRDGRIEQDGPPEDVLSVNVTVGDV